MDLRQQLKTAEFVAYLLDGRYSFFGLRIGLNTILDLIPEFGDAIALLLSLYVIWIAYKMDVPYAKLIGMIGNVLVNFFIGLIPIVGDVAYLFHKANLENLQVLKDHAEHIVEGKIVA